MTQAELPIEALAVNTIRTLSMDAVEAAKSGHPGTPMALAPIAYVLWQRVLRYDPLDPLWPGRDRFVLSCGHASMLLYSLLHLAGVRQCDRAGRVTEEPAVSLDDIRRFRQWESRCPGHPERGHTTGVETTTGPLGQGIANTVGMAIAQKWLARHFNRPGFELFDYRMYALASDGDLMEGVGAEAASLAGHLRLANLCWIYDANHITIDGTTELSFSEEVAERFAGYGWHIEHIADGNELAEIEEALADAAEVADRPTLIIARTQIGFGAPKKQGTSKAHGEPLGEEEIRGAKAAYGWPVDAKFLVPGEVPAHFRQGLGARGHRLSSAWRAKFQEYSQAHPELARQWHLIERGELPPDWQSGLTAYPADTKGLATRASGGEVLNAIAQKVPWLVGGAADLAASTKTTIKGEFGGDFLPPEYAGRNLHFGIREHAMGSALNGMALSGLRPFGSSFLVFTDYCRPAMRLSAIMGLPVIYVFTHDSIGVGEDGPTHQPIEQLASLRAMPGMLVFRPGDANEVVECYRAVLSQNQRPATIVLTRQDLPTLDRQKFAPAAGALRGGYVLYDSPGRACELILMATGSEVSLVVAAAEKLEAEGLGVRVVSLPCWELFDEQDAAYRESVLPQAVTARVAVEMGVEQGWERYLGPRGVFVGMHGYGASAPWKVLAEKFGFTVDNVVAAAQGARKAARN